MGSKAEYEARKAQRQAEYIERMKHWNELAELNSVIAEKTTTIELLKTFDRFVSSVERIADALEFKGQS